jgi:hypothetical protein
MTDISGRAEGDYKEKGRFLKRKQRNPDTKKT